MIGSTNLRRRIAVVLVVASSIVTPSAAAASAGSDAGNGVGLVGSTLGSPDPHDPALSLGTSSMSLVGSTLGSPDAHDAALASGGSGPGLVGAVLGSPDPRDPGLTLTTIRVPTSTGFNWIDFAVGAGATALLIGTAMTIRLRFRPRTELGTAS